MKPEYIAATQRKAALGECEGMCETHDGHSGECVVVSVKSFDGYCWGYWSYCEAAIARDRGRGFTVETLDNESPV